MSIDAVEAKMKTRLMDLNGLGAKVKFVLDDGMLLLDGKAMPPTVTRGDSEVDTTITISNENMMKLMDGQLNPTIAYTLGKLKVQGSMGYALKLASMLED